MGYMLPVTSYRTVQYANRLQQKRRKLQVENVHEMQQIGTFQDFMDHAMKDDHSNKKSSYDAGESCEQHIVHPHLVDQPLYEEFVPHSMNSPKFVPPKGIVINQYV